jgi:hypothetical protein
MSGWAIRVSASSMLNNFRSHHHVLAAECHAFGQSAVRVEADLAVCMS